MAALAENPRGGVDRICLSLYLSSADSSRDGSGTADVSKRAMRIRGNILIGPAAILLSHIYAGARGNRLAR